MFSSSLFFSLLLFFSIIMCFFSPSLLFVWVSLEINLLAFIMLMISFNGSSIFACMKYFIIQSVGSSLFLISSIWMALFPNSFLSLILLLSLLWKMAAAPFQGWMVAIADSLEWEIFFLISTIQKVMPLFVFLELLEGLSLALVAVSVLISLAGGLTNFTLKKMLVYSSVLSLAWIIGAGSWYEGYVYLLAYSFSLMLLSYYLVSSSSVVMSSLSFISWNNSSALFILILLLSLVGMPPMVGFFPKLMILNKLVLFGQSLEASLLLLGASAFIYIYLRFCLSSLTLSQSMAFSEMSINSHWFFFQLFLGMGIFLFIIYMCKFEFWFHES